MLWAFLLPCGIWSKRRTFRKFILFTVPDGFQYDKARYYINNQKIGLEVYIAGCTNKFVTLTGNVLVK